MQGHTKIELLQSTAENSVIEKFINKRGSGLHHIAFEVENIEEEIQRLQQAGFTVLNSNPKRGADNKLVCFVHPANTFGVLIELCQSVS
jgi:methylmalonyl-CoA/ethylmalonyl-CoA epimerase